MAKLVLLLAIICLSIYPSEELPTSQARTLLRIKRLLNFPGILRSWNNLTDFCNIEPNSSVTVVCYEDNITQLHIIGDKRASLLPQNFSIDSFLTTLVKLPSLKVLTLVSLGLWGPLPSQIARLSSLEIVNMSSNSLYGTIPWEISTLASLQTLILDDNMFSGQLPDEMTMLPVLAVLSLRRNFFNGSLPSSFSLFGNLRVLKLSHNQFLGEVPDFSSLTNLQVLDLEDNAFGPQFPRLGNKLVTLILKKNKFRSAIPSEVNSYHQLQRLDLSFNTFVGPFPPSLLSLPSITYLNIEGNRFTGKLFDNLACSAVLQFVDLSSNLLFGSLPKCLLSDSKDQIVLYASNCLETGDQNQHPLSFCTNEALAVGNLPRKKKHKEASKAVLALAITGGIVGAIAIAGLVFLVAKKWYAKRTLQKPPPTLRAENAPTGYTSKILSDSRYISQSMKMRALGLPAYRVFSLEELEEATDNFDTSAFMGEGYRGQMYKGQLKDGSLVAIRCLKMKERHSTQYFMHHIELISKLRHRHLVSALGHCFECYLNDSSVSRIFLVFEYVPNGTLRSWISERRTRQSLTCSQRIDAAIGVAKGIQFLHTGIVPGVYSNNLKITDILLDQNLNAKISSYNLPLLAEYMGKDGIRASSSGSREQSVNVRVTCEDKIDVYDFGVILLAIIVGRRLKSKNEVDIVKDKLQASIIGQEAARRSIVDPAVYRACSDQSLNTMMEICVRCLVEQPEDRPSMEDVLWNLQFASQVQDAWRGDSQSSEGSPVSPLRPQSLRLIFQ